MTRRLGLCVAAVALVGALRLPLQAQDFTSETREVMLHVSVLDSKDRLIPDIPRSAFKVTENGVEQQLKVFRREDIPVSMCLVIDSSASMQGKQDPVNTAALALLRGSNAEDETCLINFSNEAHLVQGFTRDIARLERGMKSIEAWGSTAMRDALTMALTETARGRWDKKVVIVVTDGNDTASTTELEALVRRTRDSQVLVYLIGLLDGEGRDEARRAKKALEQLAEASGGLAFFPKSLADVQAITPQIAHEIRNQYTLVYTPANAALDGSYRKVKVEVKGVGKHTVRHRPGYYASPATGGAGRERAAR